MTYHNPNNPILVPFKKFSEDQPRDENGRFAGDGGGELATLKGSDKQVSWANDVRSSSLELFEQKEGKEALDRAKTEIQEGLDTATRNNRERAMAAYQEKLEKINNLEGRLRSEDSSKFFIDNRKLLEPGLMLKDLSSLQLIQWVERVSNLLNETKKG